MSKVRTAIVINSRCNGEEPEFEEVRPDFCPACGHEIIDDDDYCPFCGEELGSLCRVKKPESDGTGLVSFIIFLAVLGFIAYMFLARR